MPQFICVTYCFSDIFPDFFIFTTLACTRNFLSMYSKAWSKSLRAYQPVSLSAPMVNNKKTRHGLWVSIVMFATVANSRGLLHQRTVVFKKSSCFFKLPGLRSSVVQFYIWSLSWSWNSAPVNWRIYGNDRVSIYDLPILKINFIWDTITIRQGVLCAWLYHCSHNKITENILNCW